MQLLALPLPGDSRTPTGSPLPCSATACNTTCSKTTLPQPFACGRFSCRSLSSTPTLPTSRRTQLCTRSFCPFMFHVNWCAPRRSMPPTFNRASITGSWIACGIVTRTSSKVNRVCARSWTKRHTSWCSGTHFLCCVYFAGARTAVVRFCRVICGAQVQLVWRQIKVSLQQHAKKHDKVIPFLLKFRDIVERLAYHIMLERLTAVSEATSSGFLCL